MSNNFYQFSFTTDQNSTVPLYNTLLEQASIIETCRRTPVFIGNISEYANDDFMLKLLSYCGKVGAWKRVKDSNQKLQNFGFCEFNDQEGGLRAMRLLNELKLGEKIIVVKADAKTRALLDEYELKTNLQLTKRLNQQNYKTPQTTMAILRTESDEDARLNIIELLRKNRDMLDGLLEQEPLINKKKLNNNILDSEEEDDPEKKYKIDNIDKFGGFYGDAKMYFLKQVLEPEELGHVLRRVDRKRAEKEKFFREQLKKWDYEEKQIEKDIIYYEQKLNKREKKRMEDSENLKKFIELYDDNIMDEKYYKGEQWQKKLDDRRYELEQDDIDQQDEEKEIEIENKKNNDKILKEKEEILKHTYGIKIELKKNNEIKQDNLSNNEIKINRDENIKLWKTNEEKRINQPLKIVEKLENKEIFEYDDEIITKKKQNLPLINDIEKLIDLPKDFSKMESEEKRKYIQKIIDLIPAEKEKLYKTSIQYDLIDHKLMSHNIKPWIAKKVKEYIGEKDRTIISYICTKVYNKCTPIELEESLQSLLDKDAEEFCIKLWRYIIFETISKSYGLRTSD